MTENRIRQNPFTVLTPEHMGAQEVHALFVQPFTQFNKLCEPGHAMLNGGRGSGKSMIFRFLLPDCQCLVHEVDIDQLDFLAFLVSIKNTGATPTLAEFTQVDDLNVNANYALNEHVLTIYVASKVYKYISTLQFDYRADWLKSASDYFQSTFMELLLACGPIEGISATINELDIADIFRHITNICDTLYRQISQYAKQLSILEVGRYTGPLCDYKSFLLPAITALRDLPFLPNGPIYLLIDDADYLNIHQAKVLNSWVSSRTIQDVSIKVSTQFHYKSLATISGFAIQSPHDFEEINISDIYTLNRGQYLKRIREIVARRLSWWRGASSNAAFEPEEFFPVNEKQEQNIALIKQRILAEFPQKGRGYCPADDVTRYARPDYIRSLAGSSKSMSTYSYAGFAQLVHISSGLVRYFLESAAIMFDEQVSQLPNRDLTCISPSIQDRVIRTQADKLLGIKFDNFSAEFQQSSLAQSVAREPAEYIVVQMERLRKLIRALGGMFYVRLISPDSSERRVFSVAISGDLSWQVKSILDLGVRLEFFHFAMIGSKDGTGRSPLYVLTRRLAPFFKLDPSSFAGYLRLTDTTLRELMRDPEAAVRRAEQSGTSSWDVDHLSLFE